MFDYNSSETIINGLYLPDGTTPAWRVLAKVADPSAAPVAGEDPFVNYFGGTQAFEVTRVAKYIDKYITQVYRNPFVTAVLEIATATVPTGGITGGTVYRLVIDAVLTQGSHSAEFARWAVHKGKPFFIEYRPLADVSNTTTAAAELAAGFKKGLKKYNMDETEITITTTGATIVVTAKSPFVRFKFIAIEELAAVGSGTGEDLEGNPASYFIAFDGTTATPAAGKFVISTPGKEGFGDYTFMISNLRIPTVEQVRFGGIFQDQLPVLGRNYTQFVIKYTKEREITGNSVLAAKAETKTSHTFYVQDTNVSDNTNPAYKFWADLVSVTADHLKETEVLTSNANSTLSATNDGILESTADNLPTT